MFVSFGKTQYSHMGRSAPENVCGAWCMLSSDKRMISAFSWQHPYFSLLNFVREVAINRCHVTEKITSNNKSVLLTKHIMLVLSIYTFFRLIFLIFLLCLRNENFTVVGMIRTHFIIRLGINKKFSAMRKQKVGRRTFLGKNPTEFHRKHNF